LWAGCRQILIVAIAGVRMFNWHRRNARTLQESSLSCRGFVVLLVFLIGTFSRVFFWYARFNDRRWCHSRTR
jgi:hypothetical protein